MVTKKNKFTVPMIIIISLLLLLHFIKFVWVWADNDIYENFYFSLDAGKYYAYILLSLELFVAPLSLAFMLIFVINPNKTGPNKLFLASLIISFVLIELDLIAYYARIFTIYMSSASSFLKMIENLFDSGNFLTLLKSILLPNLFEMICVIFIILAFKRFSFKWSKYFIFIAIGYTIAFCLTNCPLYYNVSNSSFYQFLTFVSLIKMIFFVFLGIYIIRNDFTINNEANQTNLINQSTSTQIKNQTKLEKLAILAQEGLITKEEFYNAVTDEKDELTK